VIRSLYIKNFALIDELEVSFTNGLNILTGQTGAGKSIIIGALNMILGERADTDVVRFGEKKAVAEAVIHAGNNSAVRHHLESHNIEFSKDIILRREIRSGGSRAFINDTPATITLLKKVGDYLVDLHGQHEHQQLLEEDHHRRVLDSFGHHRDILQSYKKARAYYRQAIKELNDFKERESTLQDKLQLYKFQVQELEEADLKSGEDEELEAELNRLDHAEELDQKAADILNLGSEGSVNTIDLLRVIKDNLRDMAAIEPDFETYIEEIASAKISIEEMLRFTETYQNKIEFDAPRLELLRRRQSELNRLQKKYNRTISELITYLKKIQAEVDAAENFDLEIARLEKKVSDKAAAVAKQAKLLHQKRLDTADDITAQIIEELQSLEMPDIRFEVHIEYIENTDSLVKAGNKRIELAEHGADEVRFLISANKGEAVKPLAKIASGGEISRIMLALKSVIAREQNLPVMIFDEIDTGISGAVSEKVGRKMRSLSRHCQIIAITHLPQIASKATRHYRVEKKEKEGRTITRIVHLSKDEHVQAVASLMSGTEVTSSALDSARELIAQSPAQ